LTFLTTISIFLILEINSFNKDDDGMILLRGGKFRMGTDHSDGRDGERPSKEASVGPFKIDATEVSNSQFNEFIQQQKPPYQTEA